MSDNPRHGDMFHRVTRRLRRRRHREVIVLHARVWPAELDGGYVVECVEMPGVLSQGETEAEALANIRDAITEVLIVMMRDQSGTPSDKPAGHEHPIRIAVGA